MLSFGLAVAGTYDGQRFDRAGRDAPSIYRELRPISERFEPEALSVNGLDRGRLLGEGEPPEKAMLAADEWVREVAGVRRPVLVAYPVAFDWSFLYWYFMAFAGRSPFGHASCLDIRTLYQARSRTVYDRAGKQHMPSHLRSSRPHTHNALDDAIEQGELFCNIFEWVLDTPPAAVPL